MPASHFSRNYHRAWSQLTPPLRPHADVVRAVAGEIGAPAGRTLLLGVTPELADIAPDLAAVDLNHAMVTHIWPGNTASRRAIVGDWRRMAFAPASFSACVGDGSFNVIKFPDEHAMLCSQLARVLRRGAKVVCRAYLCPDGGDTVAAACEDAACGRIGNFHAFKLRLGIAMACEAGEPSVPVVSILETFNRAFADRVQLVQRTGWQREQIDTIDFYAGSSAAYSFPTRRGLLNAVSAAFADARLVASGGYELADRCPLLVMERR